MDFFNWVSDHYILSITFALIGSATYVIPRVVATRVKASW